MSIQATHTIDPTAIDPARIAAIVREVIARIKQANLHTNATSLPDKVITVATIDALPGCPSQIFVGAKAIVTPAARDEAKIRGITISNSVEQSKNQFQPTENTSSKHEIVDATQPERATAMMAQLARRGINAIGSTIVLSETPALEVFRFCNNENQRAVMLSSISDIQRFAIELRPTVWVLDMKRMNLMSAVNAAVQISHKRLVAQQS